MSNGYHWCPVCGEMMAPGDDCACPTPDLRLINARCATCKWWGPPNHDTLSAQRECERLSRSWDTTLLWSACDDWGERLVLTHPDFGCILYERKEN